MTFSAVARDAATGDFGVAVQSKFLAAGAGVPHARAGVGAIATQALMNASFAPRGLRLLAAGAAAPEVLTNLLRSDPLAERRQVAIVDAAGRVAHHTGEGCLPWAGASAGSGFSCQGNSLVSKATVVAMARAMEEALPLPERLINALRAGQRAGGDSRGQQSAGLLVVRAGAGYGGYSDRMVDLRVDDHVAPIDELARLLTLHRRHFERPREEDLLPLEGTLAEEVATRLSASTRHVVDSTDLDSLWGILDRWAGGENLEERMIRRGFIDPIVLEVLREDDAE